MICPKCGSPYFTGHGYSTADAHKAWKDADGTWYRGPANEYMEYTCDGCSSYSYEVTKKNGKIVFDSRKEKHD